MDTIFIVLLTILGTIAAIFILGLIVRSLKLAKHRRAGVNRGRPRVNLGMRQRRLMALPLDHENLEEANLLE